MDEQQHAKRPPGTCVPWEEKRASSPRFWATSRSSSGYGRKSTRWVICISGNACCRFRIEEDNSWINQAVSLRPFRRLARPRPSTSCGGRLPPGRAPADILAECNRGMVELGNRFAKGECYLPDLMFGGMIMKGVTAELAPLLEKGQKVKTCGTVVMGSVQHDVHDIGKDIVTTTA